MANYPLCFLKEVFNSILAVDIPLPMKSHIAFISIGSNSGDRRLMLSEVKQLIVNNHNLILKESMIYETPPWGFEADTNFYNQVIKIKTTLSATQLLASLLQLETALGRLRTKNEYESRTIDLDILFFDDQIIKNSTLTIPHPKMHLRNFILVPICEIDPNKVHPVLKITMHNLLEKCPDTAFCRKLE